MFDFTSANPRTLSYDPANFEEFQQAVYDELRQNGKAWGIGRYKEERRNILRNFPQMLLEERTYHAGVDITSQPGTPLYAPLDATVFRVGKEEGIGNYGGFVILEHRIEGQSFYSFYGHLLSRHVVSEGKKIGAGERFAVIGDGADSGGWFTHTHVQLITEEAKRADRLFQGYVTKEDLTKIDSLFPSPYRLAGCSDSIS